MYVYIHTQIIAQYIMGVRKGEQVLALGVTVPQM